MALAGQVLEVAIEEQPYRGRSTPELALAGSTSNSCTRSVTFLGGWPVLVGGPARMTRDTWRGALVTGSRPTYTRTSQTPGWRSRTVPTTEEG